MEAWVNLHWVKLELFAHQKSKEDRLAHSDLNSVIGLHSIYLMPIIEEENPQIRL